jgi:hypothetical protein
MTGLDFTGALQEILSSSLFTQLAYTKVQKLSVVQITWYPRTRPRYRPFDVQGTVSRVSPVRLSDFFSWQNLQLPG